MPCSRGPVERALFQYHGEEQTVEKVGNATGSFLIERPEDPEVLKSYSVLCCRAQIGMTTPRVTVVVVNVPVVPIASLRV